VLPQQFRNDRDHAVATALVLLVNDEAVLQDRVLRGRRPALNEESVALYSAVISMNIFTRKILALAGVGEKEA
jgi:hypothetical protein